MGRAPLALARSQVNNPPDSSRRGSGRTALPARSVEHLPPSSPRTRLARKRAASLDIDSANKHPRTEGLDLDSASTPTPQTADPTQVCLCQPDPKIPRPRNGASILNTFLIEILHCDWLFCYARRGCFSLYLSQRNLSPSRKLMLLCSLHPLPAALSIPSRSPKPWPCKP